MPGKPRYFPRNIGVSSPPGESVHEFVVVWRHEFGSLPKILDVFSRHKAKVLLTHSQLDRPTNTVVGTFFCDVAQADQSVEELRKEIRNLDFVQDADFASAQRSIFDKFLFPVTVWGRDRVIVMRMDPMFNIERRLTAELGSAGAAIMFGEGEGYSSETIKHYQEVLGGVSAEMLLENVEDGLRATGWGLFDFKETKEGYVVTVQDAPTLKGATEPSRFLCGVIAGILESIFSVKMKVVESTLDYEGQRVIVRLAKTADQTA